MREKKGAVLIEVLVGLFITAIVFVGVYTTISVSLVNTKYLQQARETSGFASQYAEALMSSADCEEYSVFDYIKEKYHIDFLKRSTFKDQSAYSKNKVLPVNLPEIEAALLELWRSEDEQVICLCKSDDYTKKSVRYMRALGKKIKIIKGGKPLPRPRVKLKDRIIMNKFVYTLGLILFKKGSRVRAFLKKHI